MGQVGDEDGPRGMRGAGGFFKVGGRVKYWSDARDSWVDVHRGSERGKARPKGGDDVSMGWVGLVDLVWALVWIGWVGVLVGWGWVGLRVGLGWVGLLVGLGWVTRWVGLGWAAGCVGLVAWVGLGWLLGFGWVG